MLCCIILWDKLEPFLVFPGKHDLLPKSFLNLFRLEMSSKSHIMQTMLKYLPTQQFTWSWHVGVDIPTLGLFLLNNISVVPTASSSQSSQSLSREIQNLGHPCRNVANAFLRSAACWQVLLRPGGIGIIAAVFCIQGIGVTWETRTSWSLVRWFTDLWPHRLVENIYHKPEAIKSQLSVNQDI